MLFIIIIIIIMIDNKKIDNFKRLFLKSFEKTKNSFSDTFQIYSHENLKFIDEKKIFVYMKKIPY
jgi:hypothetical protein